MVNRPIFGALCLGLFLGTVIGMTVCHWLTGRYTPGAFVGETFGAAIGALAGIFFDRHLPKRSKRTFVVVAVTLFAIGAMPLLVTILRHGVR
jgi:H+/Cl- antiporter ClcA